MNAGGSIPEVKEARSRHFVLYENCQEPSLVFSHSYQPLDMMLSRTPEISVVFLKDLSNSQRVNMCQGVSLLSGSNFMRF